MAEKQTAEDDDEEGFGDFKFVVSSPSTYPNPTVQSSQINSLNFFSSTTNDNDDDNEWGDFIDNSSPITAKSGISGGLATTRSHPSNPIDPFEFFADSSSAKANRADVPVTNRVESEKKQWVKPQGALPLSLFGDAEEEQEEGSSVVGASDGAASDSIDRKRLDSKQNGSNMNMGMGVTDIFANLPNQTKRINVENGFNSILVPDHKIDQIKVENGLNSSSNGFNSIFIPDNKIEQINDENELNLSTKGMNWSSNLDEFASNLNGLNVVSRVYNQSEQLNVKIESMFEPVGLNSNSNGFDLKLNGLDSSINGGNGDLDEGDDGWEFQGADSEHDSGDLNSKVDQKGKGNAEVAEFASMFGNGAHGFKDLFVVSNGISLKSNELNIGFDFKPSTVAQNGFLFELHPKIEQNEDVNGNPRQSDENIDPDENIWEFKDIFAETESTHKPSTVAEVGFISDSQSISKQNEIGSESFPLPIDWKIDSDENFWEFRDTNSEFESKHKKEEEDEAADYSHGGFDVSSLDGQMQTNKTMSENQQVALPLSLFSEGKLDTDDSFNLQDGFAYKPPSTLRNGVDSQSSTMSFDVLLLDLYSQAEKTPSVKSTSEPTINELESIPMVLDSNIVKDDDDFDDNSWEFKDALSDTSTKDQNPVVIADNTPATKLKMESYMEFYTKLKDELYHIAYFHIDNLKKAKTAAALSGDDTKVGALDDEIQEAYKELHLENILSEVYTENYPPRISCLNDFFGTLQEPKFQVLESEYHMSSRLSLAEKDLKSAIELLSHATLMLKLLTSGSVEEQSNYVSAWSRMISVCAQELKHGASIWKQALQKNVHRQILFEPRGEQFIVALGEIYRVVKIIGASAKLYKPWMLSNLEDPATMFDLLEECSTLWSSSGLEEALQSISDSIGFEYKGTIKALLESIKHVHDLDVLALQANLSATQEPNCRLSVLTPAMVPDMKLVVWNGEHYFLKLVNVWANLISFDPPKLPHIHVG